MVIGRITNPDSPSSVTTNLNLLDGDPVQQVQPAVQDRNPARRLTRQLGEDGYRNRNFTVIEGAFLIFASLNPKGLLTALQQVLDELSALYTLKAMLAGRSLPAIHQIITDKNMVRWVKGNIDTI